MPFMVKGLKNYSVPVVQHRHNELPQSTLKIILIIFQDNYLLIHSSFSISSLDISFSHSFNYYLNFLKNSVKSFFFFVTS